MVSTLLRSKPMPVSHNKGCPVQPPLLQGGPWSQATSTLRGPSSKGMILSREVT